MNTLQLKSKVIIAGAGPGDADLVTVKLSIALQSADVIITDRLVNPEIIEKYARPDAKIIITGKQGYNDASISQEEINQLLIEYALDEKIIAVNEAITSGENTYVQLKKTKDGSTIWTLPYTKKSLELNNPFYEKCQPYSHH